MNPDTAQGSQLPMDDHSVAEISDGSESEVEKEETSSEPKKYAKVIENAQTFPPVIVDNEPLASSLMDLEFPSDYSIVFEEAPPPARGFRQNLETFFKQYSIPFSITDKEVITEAWSGATQWIGSVSLTWKDKLYEIATAISSGRFLATEKASSNALVVLSRLCNIIIKKTRCELCEQNQLYIDVGRPTFISEKTQRRNRRAALRNKSKNDTGMSEPKVPTKLWPKSKIPYLKLTRRLKKFKSFLRRGLYDLVFSPQITLHTRAFINEIVTGEKYHGILKIVNFNKNGYSYMSVMKLHDPKELTELLLKWDGQKDQFKLYRPRTLDLVAFWNSPACQKGFEASEPRVTGNSNVERLNSFAPDDVDSYPPFSGGSRERSSYNMERLNTFAPYDVDSYPPFSGGSRKSAYNVERLNTFAPDDVDSYLPVSGGSRKRSAHSEEWNKQPRRKRRKRKARNKARLASDGNKPHIDPSDW